MTIVSTTAELRKYADSVVAADPLLRRDRTGTILHLLRVVEILHGKESLELGADGLYAGLRERQDMLRFAIYKIFELCPAGTARPLTSSSDISCAQDTIGLFQRFAVLQDSIVAAETGYMNISFDENAQAIRFEWRDERVARGFGAVLEAATDGEHNLGERDQAARQPPASKINQFLGEIVLDERRFSFTYGIPDDLLRAFIETVVDTEEIPEIPLDWSAGPYAFGDFHNFWTVLKGVSLIHQLALIKGMARAAVAGWTTPPVNGATIPLTEGYLCKLMHTHAGLGRNTSVEIIRDLTYAPNEVSQVDVLYQPLIPMEDGHFVSIPTLLSGSNHGRNFLAVIDRLPWRKDAAQGLKDGREQFMLEQIEPLCDRLGFAKRARLRLGPPSKSIGDIDLLVWASDGTLALALSLKWFNGPDSVREVASHDECHRDGVRKHRAHVEYLRAHAKSISNDFGLSPALEVNTVFKSALVTKDARPSLAVEHENLAFVTLTELVDALAKNDGDLANLCEALETASVAAEKTSEAVIAPFTFPFGEYSVTVPSGLKSSG